FILIPTQSQSQNNKKEARKLTQHGNELYLLEKYQEALEFYLKADQFEPNVPMLDYSIGLCYSNTDQRLKALPFLEKAKNSGLTFPEINFNLGQSYLLAHKFNDAIICLEAYRKNFKPDQVEIEITDQLIYNCKNGIELAKNPVNVKITNLGP